ncbi:MAG: PAS domain S-box protein [Dehalogenimonas sp.]
MDDESLERNAKSLTASTERLPGLLSDKTLGAEIYQLFESMPWGFVLIDYPTGLISAVNGVIAELSGFGEGFPVPTTIRQIIPNYEMGDNRDLTASADTGQEYELVKVDGTKLPVEVGSRMVQVDGQAKIALFIRDITRRRQISEALHVSRLFLDKSGGLILWLNHEGNIVYANEGAIKSLGYSFAELLKMTIHQVDINFPPSLWPMMWNHFKKVQTAVMDSVFRTRDGQTFPVEISGSCVKYGDQEYNFVFAWDVSRRKEAEQALRESQQQLSAFITSATDSFYLYDVSLKLVEVNGAALNLLGMTREQAIGLNLFELGKHIGVTEHADAYQDVLTNGGRINYATATHDSKKGGRFFEVKVFQVNEGLGIIATDVTDRKLMEQELILHQTQLEQLVNERTAALAQVNVELTEQIEQRRLFTHALVHDLKTPLTPLLGASEILANGLKDDPWRKLAKNVRMGAINLNQTVSQLFDLEKGQMGLLELNCSSIDAAKLIKETAEYARAEALANEQVFLVNVSDELGRVWADSTRLSQVLMNLLNNAFKYTPRGGNIELVAEVDGEFLLVNVKDDGLGIAADDQEDVFLPYRRLKRSESRHGGLGLGLALSKKLVELHGGTINLDSREGAGSIFSVRIPTKKRDILNEEATV